MPFSTSSRVDAWKLCATPPEGMTQAKALGARLGHEGHRRRDGAARQGAEEAGPKRVGEVADRKTDHRIHRPRVEAPVEEGVLHRHASGLPRAWLSLAERWVCEVGHRLGDSPEDKADSHASREHHRHPRERRELRRGAIGSQPDVAVAGECKVAREHQEPCTDQDEQPPEVAGDPGQCLAGAAGHPLGVENSPQDEGQDQASGDTKGDPVQRKRGVVPCGFLSRGLVHEVLPEVPNATLRIPQHDALSAT